MNEYFDPENRTMDELRAAITSRVNAQTLAIDGAWRDYWDTGRVDIDRVGQIYSEFMRIGLERERERGRVLPWIEPDQVWIWFRHRLLKFGPRIYREPPSPEDAAAARVAGEEFRRKMRGGVDNA